MFRNIACLSISVLASVCCLSASNNTYAILMKELMGCYYCSYLRTFDLSNNIKVGTDITLDPSAVGLAIQSDKAYIIHNRSREDSTKGFMQVYDLHNREKIGGDLEFEFIPDAIEIYNNRAYILAPDGWWTRSILKSFKLARNQEVETNIKLHRPAVDMAIQSNKAYILLSCKLRGTIMQIYDLDTYKKIGEDLKFSGTPKSIQIYNNYAYILSELNKTTSVKTFDLSNNQKVGTDITFEDNLAGGMAIQSNKAYILQNNCDVFNYMQVYDLLNSEKIGKDIRIPGRPRAIVLYESDRSFPELLYKNQKEENFVDIYVKSDDSSQEFSE